MWKCLDIAQKEGPWVGIKENWFSLNYFPWDLSSAQPPPPDTHQFPEKTRERRARDSHLRWIGDLRKLFLVKSVSSMVPKSLITNIQGQRVRSKCCGYNLTADSLPKSKQIDSPGSAWPRGRGVDHVTSSPHHSRNQELGSCAIQGVRILATPHN